MYIKNVSYCIGPLDQGLCCVNALSLYMALSQQLKENHIKITPVSKLAEDWSR